MMPTFTVLIGASGFDRPDRYAQLWHSLDSVKRQHRVSGDQVIVSFDSFEQDQTAIQARIDRVHSYGEGFIACEYDSGYHWLGVEQINYAMRTIPIPTSHIFTIGDDDVFVDGAYFALRHVCRVYPQRPIIYRFLAPNRALLWDIPRMRACLISGCCIAAPNEFVGPMHTRIETTHDYDWMMDVLSKADRAGQKPLWLDWVGVIARPDKYGDDVTHKGIWQCWHCKSWGYLEDISLASFRCRGCGIAIELDSHLPKIVNAVEEVSA